MLCHLQIFLWCYFCNFFFIICFPFSPTLLFLFAHFHYGFFPHVFQCTLHFHWSNFLQSKLNFHFDLTPPFFTKILRTLKKKLKINIFCQNLFCQLYENQPKYLKVIEFIFLKRCNVLKNTQCNCANEMQCVKVKWNV
jgi:hypothetical protein